MLSSEKSPDIRNLQSLHLSLSQADKLHVLHPWTDLSALGDGCPLIMTSASGIRVSDSQGRTYLDAIGGMWCMTLGYGRTELAIAMSAQAQRMAYYTPFGDIGNEPAARLAEVLAEITPGDLDRVHFTTGGSTAIDSAVRISHYYFASQGRYSKRWVLSRHNAYHGSTFLAASLSGKAADRTLFHYEESFVHHLSSQATIWTWMTRPLKKPLNDLSAKWSARSPGLERKTSRALWLSRSSHLAACSSLHRGIMLQQESCAACTTFSTFLTKS